MSANVFARTAALAGLVGLSACATPGIDYQARVMPANLDAAATRLVQVDTFRGPAGGWYAGRFEAMLANTTLDGQSWFQLANFDYSNTGTERAGTYTGHIDITDYTTEEYYRTVRKCVEWDGLFDCERRADVEELCIVDRVSVRVSPRLIDAADGRTVFSGSYGGDSSRKDCHETGKHGHRHRRGGGGLFGFGGGTPPPDMVYEALSETLGPIRRDIAPRNTTVRATFITEALDPVVAADPRFENAVELASDNPFASCEAWTVMAAQYPEAPAVIHNMGACAEASSDFQAAQGLYAQASELSVKYTGTGIAGDTFIKALQKLSNQRNDEQILQALTALPEVDSPEAPKADEAGS